jgi:hypothetical protein
MVAFVILAGLVGARCVLICLRPPFAQERLPRRSDGRVALELKTAWHDGMPELVFEPLEFLERLAAMTPRPPGQSGQRLGLSTRRSHVPIDGGGSPA